MTQEVLQKWDFLFYRWDDWNIKIQVVLEDGTVWLTQKSMAEVFWTTKQNISLHLNNIYNEDELNRKGTVKEILLQLQQLGLHNLLI